VTPDSDSRTGRRTKRARDLAGTNAAAPLLTFYARLGEEQGRLLARDRDRPQRSCRDGRLADVVDRDAVVSGLGELLAWLPAAAPATLTDSVAELTTRSPRAWRHRLDDYIAGLPESVEAGCEGFVLEAALQPFAEECAAAASAYRADERAVSDRCPFCGDRPAVAALREAGHGARRSFVCGLCLTEWPAPRLGCTGCGESGFERLPVFRTDDIVTARIDACDACGAYMKTIDLTRDGHAIPVVDDLATVTLDLWARDRGYYRLRPNLLRL
jgi:FdhE protein